MRIFSDNSTQCGANVPYVCQCQLSNKYKKNSQIENFVKHFADYIRRMNIKDVAIACSMYTYL